MTTEDLPRRIRALSDDELQAITKDEDYRPEAREHARHELASRGLTVAPPDSSEPHKDSRDGGSGDGYSFTPALAAAGIVALSLVVALAVGVGALVVHVLAAAAGAHPSPYDGSESTLAIAGILTLGVLAAAVAYKRARRRDTSPQK